MSSSASLCRAASSISPLSAAALARCFQVSHSALLHTLSPRNLLSLKTLEFRTLHSLFFTNSLSSEFNRPLQLLISSESSIWISSAPRTATSMARHDGYGGHPDKHKEKEGRKCEHFLLKGCGQHLLINQHILDAIIRKAKVLPTDTVLEIGPGTGNLTIRLLQRAAMVIAIEIDARMVDTLQERVSELGLQDKLLVITGNALKMEFPHFDICVANIPYGISSPLMEKLFLRSCKPCFRSATLLLQKEFARRLLAKPGDSDFNRLAVNVRLVATVDFLMNVSKKNFVPCPKVDSSLVQIWPRTKLPDININEWLAFTRICFGKKNKTLGAIFKQKKKIVELYEKSKSSQIDYKGSQHDDHASDHDIDDILEYNDCGIGLSCSAFEGQNSADILMYKERIARILNHGGFSDKRPSKLSNEDFLYLLQLFNKDGVFFHF